MGNDNSVLHNNLFRDYCISIFRVSRIESDIQFRSKFGFQAALI